jgi:1-deoxy-D-xylulose-5-phosphate synthase
MRFVKPLDEEIVLTLAANHDALVTVEENVIAGGAGSAINEVLLAAGIQMPVLNCGIPDRFIEHGARNDCLRDAGLDREGLERRITRWCQAGARSAHSRPRALHVIGRLGPS